MWALAGIVLCAAGLAAAQAGRTIATVPGMPPVTDPANLYSDTLKLSPAVAGALPRVYVPNRSSNWLFTNSTSRRNTS